MFLIRSVLPEKANLNVLKHKLIFFSLSIILSLVSIFGLYFKNLNYGIDFTGGILIEAKIEDLNLEKLRIVLKNADLGEVAIQTVGENGNVMIKTSANADLKDKANLIKEAISSKFPKVEYRKIEQVGGEIGSEMVIDGFIAITLTFIGIMLYIWFRFTWQYSVGIVVGLIHVLLLTTGFLVFSGYEFNNTSIAAILTILGYSVNDTVVLYDRIREVRHKAKKFGLNYILDSSINETIYRTTFTVITVLLTALALIIFGGEALHSFSVTVFVGILIGTYTSIFISVPMLAYFKSLAE